MFWSKRDQLFDFQSKIVDFRAVLRKKAYMQLSCGLCYKTALKKFQLATKLAKICRFSKNLTFLKFSDSCLSNYAVSFGDFCWSSGQFSKNCGKSGPFLKNLSFRPPKHLLILRVLANCNWHDLTNLKSQNCPSFCKLTDFWQFCYQLKIEEDFHFSFIA